MALVPEVVRKLTGQGHEVARAAGRRRRGADPRCQYEEAGAKLVDDAAAVYGADVVVKVAPAERRGDGPAAAQTAC